MRIVTWEDRYLIPVLGLWQVVFGDRLHDFRVPAEGAFRDRALNHPAFHPDGALVATDGKFVTGCALAVAPEEVETGFLSLLMVDPAHRGRGVGSALLDRAGRYLKSRGKKDVRVGYRGNPISFATGVDVRTPGYYFLMNRGFRNDGSVSLVMRLEFAAYAWPERVTGFLEENRERGIRCGLCGDEHREPLARFMEETFPGGWEASVKGSLVGDPPHPVLVATEGPRVVGFAGPVRVQSDGHGAFTGIGTHPDFRRHKIGTLLFHLLCAEFKRRGATYCVLHTGLRNPAQQIYFGAGFRVIYLVDYSLVKPLG